MRRVKFASRGRRFGIWADPLWRVGLRTQGGEFFAALSYTTAAARRTGRTITWRSRMVRGRSRRVAAVVMAGLALGFAAPGARAGTYMVDTCQRRRRVGRCFAARHRPGARHQRVDSGRLRLGCLAVGLVPIRGCPPHDGFLHAHACGRLLWSDLGGSPDDASSGGPDVGLFRTHQPRCSGRRNLAYQRAYRPRVADRRGQRLLNAGSGGARSESCRCLGSADRLQLQRLMLRVA